VVVDSVHHFGLAVTRSLGRLGIPVFNIDSSRLAPAFFSRYCRGRFVWNFANRSPDQSVEYLMNIGRKIGGRPILIATTDRGAIFLAENAAALAPGFLFPVCPAALIRKLSSKRDMADLAATAGVPAPRTICPQSKAQLLESVDQMQPPLIAKADQSHRRFPGGKTKLILRTRADISDFCSAVDEETARSLIVQEFIPGGEDTVWMFNGYFNEDSECLVGFTGRKIRQCPPYTGVTSLGLCQQNDEIANSARRFLGAVHYRGVVDIDYRYDARDGQYKILDVNPRIGGTFRLFVAENGMDVARALYLDLTGQGVRSSPPQNGRKWMVEDFDLVAALTYRRDGVLGFREWLKSYNGLRERAFLAWDDPVPVLGMLCGDLAELHQRARPGVRPPGPKIPPDKPGAGLPVSEDQEDCPDNSRVAARY
jgi:predicted ATP-grasp superfamily ATP-dependent carboligase